MSNDSDPTPPITWTIAPDPRPFLVAGDEVMFKYDGGEIVHVVTEAEQQAGQFTLPDILARKEFRMTTRHRTVTDWSPDHPDYRDEWRP